MKVLLFPDASSPKVTVNLTLLVGSRHEGYGETGMAHLLEHMLFKGTPTHQNIPKELQARGAQFNGTTWYGPYQLLRNTAGNRGQPGIRAEDGSRSHDEQLCESRRSGLGDGQWSVTNSNGAKTARRAC